MHAYTSRFPLTIYVGIIWCSDAEATASMSTVEDTLRACCSYWMHDTPVTVAAAYPQSALNGTPTCSSLSNTAPYETYVASLRNQDVYVKIIKMKHVNENDPISKCIWFIVWSPDTVCPTGLHGHCWRLLKSLRNCFLFSFFSFPFNIYSFFSDFSFTSPSWPCPCSPLVTTLVLTHMILSLPRTLWQWFVEHKVVPQQWHNFEISKTLTNIKP